VSANEREFAQQLVTAIQELGAWIGDRVFLDATLSSKVVTLPRRTIENEGGVGAGSKGPQTNCLIVLKLVIPIHVNVLSANCDLIPLNFFKVHQLADKASPHHGTFVRSVHRELAPVVNSVPVTNAKSTSSVSNRGKAIIEFPRKLRKLRKGDRNGNTRPVDSDGNPIPFVFGRSGKTETGSNQSSSTLNLWRGPASDIGQRPSSSSYERTRPTQPEQGNNKTALGGIMVSQEITVDVHDVSEGVPPPERVVVSKTLNQRPSQGTVLAGNGDDMSPRSEGEDIAKLGLHTGVEMQVANIEVERFNEVATFVDELFAACVDNR
jgi:hypothetical protein